MQVVIYSVTATASSVGMARGKSKKRTMSGRLRDG
jgi:hypothetical protein